MMSFVFFLRYIHMMLVLSEGLEGLYMSIAETHGIYIMCCRWAYMCVLSSGRLEHVYIFTCL
jgi:hypothetical protein